MIQKTDVIKMARHIFRHNQGYADRKLMHPRRDWSLLLVFAAATFLIGAMFAVFTYFEFEEIISEPTPEFVNTVQYDTEQAESALTLFAEREAQFAALREQGTQTTGVSTASATSTATSTPARVADVPEPSTADSEEAVSANNTEATSTKEIELSDE